MTKSANNGIEFDDQSRSPGWVDLKAGSGSVIKVTTPFVIGPEGATNIVDINLKEVDVATSVNYASVLQSPKVEVSNDKKKNHYALHLTIYSICSNYRLKSVCLLP
jgi:hypothetical protein